MSLFINRIKQFFISRILPNTILTANCKKYNLKFNFLVKDGVGKDIYYKYGVYAEDYITEYLLKEVGINDNDLILDIGANIGWYSLVLSTDARPTVFAFEPEPFNFKLLQSNIEINNRTNIRAINAAVSNEEGSLTLHLYKKSNLGRHSFIKHEKSVNSIDVPTLVIDKFLEENAISDKIIKFIKVDIEGFEFTALKGATKALRNAICVLTEFSPDLMNQINDDPKKFLEYMYSFGFNAYDISSKGITSTTMNTLLETNEVRNIIWLKK